MIIIFELVGLSIFFIIMTLGFGGIYSIIRERSCINIQKTIGANGFLLFSFIGTPVHELSHYIACKVFFHKVTKVVLFSPKSWKASGTMGCVEHSYNPKKIYQLAGNFIIGVAPVIGGVGVCSLIMKYFLGGISKFIPVGNSLSITLIINSLKNMFVGIIGIFSVGNLILPIFWIMLFVLINIFLHVSLSKADFKNAYIGIIFFIILIPLIGYILSFSGIPMESFIMWCFKVNFYFLFTLIFGFIIDLLIWVLSICAFNIKKIYYKKGKGLIIK